MDRFMIVFPEICPFKNSKVVRENLGIPHEERLFMMLEVFLKCYQSSARAYYVFLGF